MNQRKRIRLNLLRFPLPPRLLLLLDQRLGLVLVAALVPLALQALHLARLQLAQVELAHVDAAELVAHDVSRNVLLGPLLACPGLAHRLLEHRRVGFLDAAQTKVHARAVLLELDARELLARALRADRVDAQAEDGPGRRVVVVDGGGRLVGRHHDAVPQAFDVNLVGGFAAEEVEEHGLGHGEGVGHGGFTVGGEMSVKKHWEWGL